MACNAATSETDTVREMRASRMKKDQHSIPKLNIPDILFECIFFLNKHPITHTQLIQTGVQSRIAHLPA